jgi:hypothetical protein
LANVESDWASDSRTRKTQKTKTLENFPRVCHDPSRWTTEVTPRPAAAASIVIFVCLFVCLRRKDVEWDNTLKQFVNIWKLVKNISQLQQC